MAEEESSSTVGSPFHQVGSSCSASQPVGNNNANALCLFYSASSNSHNGYNSNASSSGHHLPSYGIQSSRASNSWIASLRSKTNDQSPTRSMEWRQHHHEPSTIGAATVYARSCSSPSLMNGPLDAGHGKSSSNNRPPRPPRPPLAGWPSPSSSSLSSSFYRSASLETIEKNRRLRQLALQSTSRVRSLTARESTAAAERWRYIQTVLQRRRRESQERRERFIRQPLENIIRQKAAARQHEQPQQPQQQQHGAQWPTNIVRRSILKRRARQEIHQRHHITTTNATNSLDWMMKTNGERRVRFELDQLDKTDDDRDADDADDADDDDDDDGDQVGMRENSRRDKLPVLSLVSISTEDGVGLVTASDDNDQTRRLPPLVTPTGSCLGAELDSGRAISGPSWVERQVAKVRQRKLWARQQQQQQNHHQQQQQQQQQQLGYKIIRNRADGGHVRLLKRSVSLLVNVSDDAVSDTDSLEIDRADEEVEEEEEDEEDEEEEVDDEDRSDAVLVVDDNPVGLMSDTVEFPIIERAKNHSSWLVWLGKNEADSSFETANRTIRTDKQGRKVNRQIGEEQVKPIPEPYGGWADFPVRLAVGIQRRQDKLKEKRASRKRSTRSNETIGHSSKSSNSFTRRKRFSKRLLKAVIRLRSRKIQPAKTTSQSTSHQQSTDPAITNVASWSNDGQSTSRHPISSRQPPSHQSHFSLIDSSSVSSSTGLPSLTTPAIQPLAKIPEEMADPAEWQQQQQQKQQSAELQIRVDRPKSPQSNPITWTDREPEEIDSHSVRSTRLDDVTVSEGITDTSGRISINQPIQLEATEDDRRFLSIVNQQEVEENQTIEISNRPTPRDDVHFYEREERAGRDPLAGSDGCQFSDRIDNSVDSVAEGWHLKNLATRSTRSTRSNPKDPMATEGEKDCDQMVVLSGSSSWLAAGTAFHLMEEAVEEGMVTRIESDREVGDLKSAGRMTTDALNRLPSPPMTVSLDGSADDGHLVIADSAIQQDPAELKDPISFDAIDEPPAGQATLSTLSNQKRQDIPLSSSCPACPACPACPSVATTFEAWTSQEEMRINDNVGYKSCQTPHDASIGGVGVVDHLAGDSNGVSWLDKKTKEARNVLTMSFVTIATQTEPHQETTSTSTTPNHPNEIFKSIASRTSSAASSSSCSDIGQNIRASSSDQPDCRCLHRAVLTCLLPEAADTLASLEIIRRQLKKARIRQQQQQQQATMSTMSHSTGIRTTTSRHSRRQPLPVRVDVSGLPIGSESNNNEARS